VRRITPETFESWHNADEYPSRHQQLTEPGKKTIQLFQIEMFQHIVANSIFETLLFQGIQLANIVDDGLESVALAAPSQGFVRVNPQRFVFSLPAVIQKLSGAATQINDGIGGGEPPENPGVEKPTKIQAPAREVLGLQITGISFAVSSHCSLIQVRR
jgi:hypothetical protein